MAVAIVVGTTIGMSGIGPAEAAPSTPVADECWSCGFDQTDSTYDDSGFTDDLFESWPFYEPPAGFNGGARRLDWREARPYWRSRFGVRRWRGMFRPRGGFDAPWAGRFGNRFAGPDWPGRGTGATFGTLSLENQVYAMTNGERDREQCPDLRLDYALSRAARNHSRDMAELRYMSHTDYNNEDPAERMERSGYPIRYGWAENIAYGSRTAGQVMDAWMTSPGHRKNILDCNLRAIGVGVARAQDGTLFWTQNFGGR